MLPTRNRSSRDISPFAARIGVCAAGAASAVAGCLLAPSALAQTEGGAVFLEPPKVTKVDCLRACASRGRVQSGSTLRVRGKALAGVDSMIFHGANGRGDDARARRMRAGSRPLSPWAARGRRRHPRSGRARRGPRSGMRLRRWLRPRRRSRSFLQTAICPSRNGSSLAALSRPLFLRPTGLADGLAPKERRYGSIPPGL